MSGTRSNESMRSPRAPKYALHQAISYAVKIYDAVHRSSISSATAYELMGFSGKTGPSATALGAVRQFGLIEGVGDKTKVTDLAMSIFEPESQSERSTALRTAADRPEIFRAIKDRFNSRIPTADEPLRAFLIREQGFSKAGAEETIKALRSTDEYLQHNADLQNTDVSASVPKVGSAMPVPVGHDPEQQEQSGAAASDEVIRVALTRDCAVEMRFFGALDERAIGNLIKYAELMKNVWSDS